MFAFPLTILNILFATYTLSTHVKCTSWTNVVLSNKLTLNIFKHLFNVWQIFYICRYIPAIITIKVYCEVGLFGTIWNNHCSNISFNHFTSNVYELDICRKHKMSQTYFALREMKTVCCSCMCVGYLHTNYCVQLWTRFSLQPCVMLQTKQIPYSSLAHQSLYLTVILSTETYLQK